MGLFSSKEKQLGALARDNSLRPTFMLDLGPNGCNVVVQHYHGDAYFLKKIPSGELRDLICEMGEIKDHEVLRDFSIKNMKRIKELAKFLD